VKEEDAAPQLNTMLLRKASNEASYSSGERFSSSFLPQILSSIPTAEDLVAQEEPRLHLVAVAEELAR
jgi:hypothetical protein